MKRKNAQREYGISDTLINRQYHIALTVLPSEIPAAPANTEGLFTRLYIHGLNDGFGGYGMNATYNKSEVKNGFAYTIGYAEGLRRLAFMRNQTGK